MGTAQLPAGRRPVAAKAGAWRSALSLPTAAAGAGFVALALAVVYFVLAGLGHELTPHLILLEGTLFAAFGGVGVVLALRQPRNRIGWIMLGCIIVLGLGGIAARYAVLAYRLGHHGLPLASVAVVLGNSVQVLAVLAIPVIILLFPDGRLPGPRWRWLLWAYAGFGACVMALTVAAPIAEVADHDIRIDSSGNLISSPGLLAGAARLGGCGRGGGARGDRAADRGPPRAGLATGDGRAPPAAEVAGIRGRGQRGLAARHVVLQLPRGRDRGGARQYGHRDPEVPAV
jgi:hypothetical protein